MTRCFYQTCRVSVQKSTHPHKGCGWLTIRIYYGSTNTKKLRLVNISFDTLTNKNGDKDNNSLTIVYLSSDAGNAGKGKGGGLGNHHCRLPRALAMVPLLPLLPAMVPSTSSASLALSPPPVSTVLPMSSAQFARTLLPSNNEHAWVHPAGHLCCGHTISANCRSDSALALIHSTLAHHCCSHYCPGHQGAQEMQPPWQACAGRWSSGPSLPCPRPPGASRSSLQWCCHHRHRHWSGGRRTPAQQMPTATLLRWRTLSAGG
jgi:hypothetical protein